MSENKLFPGRPNYTGPTTGWFGLLHHDLLFEESHDVNERIAYVRHEKPAREIDIRLRNMIYLGALSECWAKRDALDAYYRAKRAPLDAEILSYIKSHIPDCAWNGSELVFAD